MRILRYGERALLVELADGTERRGFHAALEAARLSGILELVPAARTVLVSLAPDADPASVAAELAAVRGTDDLPPDAEEPLAVPVRYDGADLDEVARLLDLTPSEVVEWHTGQVWHVEFTGFAPGFGYLRGETERTVPRRDTPRTRIPAGAVALAGIHTGIYPRASPGGWQLIGRTDLAVWDAARNPPALLTPGRPVRFEVTSR